MKNSNQKSGGSDLAAQADIVKILRQHQPEVWLPHGETVASVRNVLRTMSIDGSATGELAGYAEEDCERFLQTVALVPDVPGALLEIGSNPYFTTTLLAEHRPGMLLSGTNYFDGTISEITQTVSLELPSGAVQARQIVSRSVNVETDIFPWADQTFDVILFCEVIEHLLNDPVHSLREIWRLLKPDGLLILTTPNVARLENVARMIAGANLYDPYSGYGPYGRHNREFTRHELWRLLSYLGFEADVLFTADVNQNRAELYSDTSKLADLVRFRSNDLGQYIFSRWRKTSKSPPLKRPSWLYRSLPKDQIEIMDL